MKIYSFILFALFWVQANANMYLVQRRELFNSLVNRFMKKNGVSGTLTSCLSNLDVVFVRISWNANRPMDTKMDKPMELETALTLLHYLHMYVGARKTVIFFRGRE